LQVLNEVIAGTSGKCLGNSLRAMLGFQSCIINI
jgi:hypothetical protein